jgi:biopolymer transport protein ExbB
MPQIDVNYFHHICILALYGAAGVLTFVVVERLVYYALLSLRLNALGAVMHGSTRKATEKTFTRGDVLTRSVAQYLEAIATPGMSRSRLEDLSMSQFIKVDGRVGARLWLLDTIVTAAPLLGLLGTILGIMDTFTALSSGGISDPAAVSRGIAAALLATAIGIGVALYGLLGHNLLHRVAGHLTEGFKRLILVSEGYAARAGTLTRATDALKAA